MCANNIPETGTLESKHELTDFDYKVPEFAPLSVKNNIISQITSITLIAIVSLLSVVFIGVELYRKADLPLQENLTTRSEFMKNNPDATDNTELPPSQNCPAQITRTEYTYDYTNSILLYGTFALIASLILVGCFMILLRCQKSEEEECAKIQKERLALYREAQMAIIDIRKANKKPKGETKVELSEEFAKQIKEKTEELIRDKIDAVIDSIAEQWKKNL